MKSVPPIDQTLEFAKNHQQFKDLYFKQHEEEFLKLVHQGQNPQTIFIGCSDSRVVPDLIIGTRPGDLFVIRTAGNFVPPYNKDSGPDGVSATIQFGIEVLGIKHIVVCGHSHCGAIQGLYQDLSAKGMSLIQNWLQFGIPAKKMALETLNSSVSLEVLYKTTEQVSVIFQLENLLTYPFIRERVEKGQLQLHGWYFVIETGQLQYYDVNNYVFRPISEVRNQE